MPTKAEEQRRKALLRALDDQKWEVVRVKDDIVGYLSVCDSDFYWLIPDFKEGPDFSKYDSTLGRQRRLADKIDMLEDDDTVNENELDKSREENLDLLTDNNELDLILGGKPIRDFQFVSSSRVEFKHGSWR
jgi:hypothetical protein